MAPRVTPAALATSCKVVWATPRARNCASAASRIRWRVASASALVRRAMSSVRVEHTYTIVCILHRPFGWVVARSACTAGGHAVQCARCLPLLAAVAPRLFPFVAPIRPRTHMDVAKLFVRFPAPARRPAPWVAVAAVASAALVACGQGGAQGGPGQMPPPQVGVV